MNFDLINEFFDHVYVLTLKRATDRHEKFAKTLQGLRYEVFYGKDKNDFDVNELKQAGIYDEELAKKHERRSIAPNAGMIGCSWSHRLIYEDMILKQYSNALILEDDIVLNKNTWQFLPNILTELPADWELIYFGFAKNEMRTKASSMKQLFYHLLKFVGALKYSHTTINNLFPKEISRHIYTSGFHDCTHAYGITFEGAKKLVAMQTPISYYPDNLLAFAATNKILKAYISLPKLIDQEYQVGMSSQSYVNS
ncbi:MAG: hypothetical protein NVSMB45_01920 [Ginsengibacter sp.]